MKREKFVHARLTDDEVEILEAVIGTLDVDGREPASPSEAVRFLLRQWARDYNFKFTGAQEDGKDVKK